MRKVSPKYRALGTSEGILLRDQLLAIGREHKFTEEELRQVTGISTPAFEKLLRLPDSNVVPNAYTRFRLAKAIHELGGKPISITVSKAWLMVNLGRGTEASSKLVKVRYSPDMHYKPMNGKPWGDALIEAREANAQPKAHPDSATVESLRARRAVAEATKRLREHGERVRAETTPVRTPALPKPSQPALAPNDAPLWLAAAAFLMALVGLVVLIYVLLSPGLTATMDIPLPEAPSSYAAPAPGQPGSL